MCSISATSMTTTVITSDIKHSMLAVPVLFLDDTTHTFHIEKSAKGSTLLEQVFEHVELSEKDYFGLQFVRQPDDVIRWLDPHKTLRKQWSPKTKRLLLHADATSKPLPFQFRVKFYVSDPSRLQDECTRYQFYLQIKRDIWHNRLPCPPNTVCLLASYTVQAELGDYSIAEHGAATQYLSQMQLVRDASPEMMRRIAELHKLHRGQLPADAEYNYLEHAKKLYMYGVDIHTATDSNSKDINLGVTHLGLIVFQNNVRMNVFSWSKMVKISFKRKEFFIQLRREPSENYDTLLGFGMFSHRRAKALWKSCVEHHSFFRLEQPNRQTRFRPLSLGSRFYYSGRTEVQANQASLQRPPTSATRTVNRGAANKRKAEQQRAAAAANNGHQQQQSNSDGTTTADEMAATAAAPTNDATIKRCSPGLFGQVAGQLSQSCRSHSDAYRVTTEAKALPRKAWEHPNDEYDLAGGEPLSDVIYAGQLPMDPAKSASTSYEQLNQQQPQQPPPHQRSITPIHLSEPVDPNDPSLVTICLQADGNGRFGFNVRGGVDLKLPVLVSRVAPQTPADRSVPRICEGDQVVLINGHDVSNLMHEEVVSLIRSSREYRSGELVLTVKPNALIDATGEEPDYQYVPDGHDGSMCNSDVLFTQSLLLLNDGLASGALLSQYEQLYRTNAGLAITEARKPENLTKNRYRDISPYDCTRVVLINQENGDYINANYVNMEIPTDGVNRYIATQGPLASTICDFWRMVQQESSHLVVMLTTVMERGRQKCHQYWPAAGETIQLSDTFQVRCLGELADETGSFVLRDLQMSDRVTGEQRAIQHMQYLAWPDHGVPADPELFLEFTQQMRLFRKTSLLQEIDMSLAQIRLMDDDKDDFKCSAQRLTNDSSAASVAGVSNDAADDSSSEQRVRARIAQLAEPEDDDDDADEPARQNADDVDVPLSTSIHQFISAANPPIIVHCSAGIGRTGVLILMDTALALMDAKEPVYPLDVVQAMRDQRACMVQNVSQYRFVCECICVAYAKKARTESTCSTAANTTAEKDD